MRTIIAGSRTITEYAIVLQAIAASGFKITSVVSGTASGVDRLGERYAREQALPLHQYPAEWVKHGKSAGPIRNRKMADNAEALIAIWDGESSGTRNMIQEALKRSLEVYVHNVQQPAPSVSVHHTIEGWCTDDGLTFKPY